MSLFRKSLFPVILVAAFLAVFGVGFWVGREQVVCEICPPQNVNFSLFWEAWQKLQEKYVDPTKFNTENMIYGAISGMVNSLDDPYTVFFNPDESKAFLEDVSGRFEGVGMEIGSKNNQLQVIAPLEGTPAEKAGLRPGDKIVKINDTFTTNLTIDEAVKLIRGPQGTEVALSILREGWNAPKEFKIRRALIEVPSLKTDMISSSGQANGEKDIAYIKLYQFSENASYDFTRAALDILNSPAKKIILDLRSNPGGYLEIAKNIAGWFLEKGQTVVIEDFNNRQKQVIYAAEGNSKISHYPLVVLINEGSASASEILAAALRDNRSIKLIGTTSYGKGSVQELESLNKGSSLKITVADWLTPKGAKITGVGLKPDIEVQLTEEDYQNNKDPQLDKALEIIKELK